MSPYHRSDKEEWDEVLEESRERRRHHYDPYEGTVICLVCGVEIGGGAICEKCEDIAQRYSGSELLRRKPSNGWDW